MAIDILCFLVKTTFARERAEMRKRSGRSAPLWQCYWNNETKAVVLLPSVCSVSLSAPPLLLTSPCFLWLLFSVDPSPVGESKHRPGQSSAPAPPPRLNPSASSPNFFKYLKHNSSGEQSGNAVPKSISYRNALRKKLHSSSSVPNFLKFLAPVDENNTSDFMNTKR